MFNRDFVQVCRKTDLLRCAAAMILSSAGAAIGTAKSGIGIAGIGTFKPELIMKVSASEPSTLLWPASLT